MKEFCFLFIVESVIDLSRAGLPVYSHVCKATVNTWHTLCFYSIVCFLFCLFFYTSHLLYRFLSSYTFMSFTNPPSLSFLSPDSADGQPVLLPPEQVQEMNLRSTSTLNAVQRLFSHHLIQTFGCDYSTSGLSLDTLQAKLRSFLDLRTADGPRHDNYLIYYSGHTLPTGDWALTGKS